MGNEIGKPLGLAVAKARKKSKLTQEQLAESIGISTRTFQDYEAGEILPRYETLFKIAKATNTTATALMRPMWLEWKDGHKLCDS